MSTGEPMPVAASTPRPARQKLAENTERSHHNDQHDHQAHRAKRFALHGVDAAVHKLVYLFLVFRIEAIPVAAVLLSGSSSLMVFNCLPDKKKGERLLTILPFRHRKVIPRGNYRGNLHLQLEQRLGHIHQVFAAGQHGDFQ